jgi:crotonobetainyl-CoA:carnitine CoA-transferase CaiB-like acyl-CoA transferase
MLLEGTVVVECAERIAGPLAGMHLRRLGAEVLKVEPPEGDVARSWGSGAAFSLLNEGKRLLTLPTQGTPIDPERLAELLMAADVAIVDDELAGALARDAAGSGRLRSVVVIGADDVPGGYGATETTAQAAMAVTPYVGEAGQPTRLGTDLAAATAGLQAAQAALAGLVSAAPSTVASVSLARALATHKTIHFAGRSDPAAWDGYHVTAGERPPDRGYRTADGRISFEFPPNMADAWRAFCRRFGLDDLVEELGVDWYPTVGMGERSDWVRPRYEAALQTITRQEAVAAAREVGGWAVPFLDPAEALREPQVARYGALFVDAEAGGARLGSPWKFAGVTDAPSTPAPAPDPGHDNAHVSTIGGERDG